jgi:hypothetical protein
MLKLNKNQQFEYLNITYADPENLNDQIVVTYKLRNNSIVPKWVDRVCLAQQSGYTIDDPERFYGFDSIDKQKDDALRMINLLLDKLENFWHIPVGRRLTSVNDQDTLNYLHHIFEVEHGLLNEKKLNPQFQKHISDLNILVHRCESIQRGNYPRHVVTYFGLPKTVVLDDSDYENFEPGVTFGTVYLNYVEIGKTLHDLMMDNDSYIDPTAFRPFKHYSADFVVKFWDDKNENLIQDLQLYYNQHEQFFLSLGYNWKTLSRSIGFVPLADIVDTNDAIMNLKTHQFVKAVDFS